MSDPTKILLKITRVIIPLFVSIINGCLSAETFPSALKSAIVNPPLKKSNLGADQMSNYRPVSHLPFISKVIENVIASQIINHLNQNNLMEKFHSAYRPHHSTETALVRVLNDFTVNLDKVMEHC